ncbi:hypothetical protein [Actinomadura sp. 9N215]
MSRFEALAWYGTYTELYWAMIDNRFLVQAETPQALGERIMSVRRAR